MTTHDVATEGLHWYGIYTHLKQEGRAASNLTAWGVETFNPKRREFHYNPYTGKPMYLVKPLFQRYIFARFDIKKSLHKVNWTRGVHSVIRFGGHPVPIQQSVISLMQERVAPDGLIRMADDFKLGDKVEIKDGPLKDFTGIFQREMSDEERVVILLTTVKYQAHVVVEKGDLRKVG